MKKFNVGDRVRVRKNAKWLMNLVVDNWTNEMDETQGQIGTVIYCGSKKWIIYNNQRHYEVQFDGGIHWSYIALALEPIKEKENKNEN